MAVAGGAMADRIEATLSPARAESAMETAFETFVAGQHERVRRLAGRLLGWRGDAEDVVQDVFLTVFERRTRLAEIRDRERWLTTLTLNACRRRHRRNALWQSCIGWLGRRIEECSVHPAGLESDERSERTRRAVASLPQSYREVIVLRYLEELEISEIAALAGVSVDAVAARLSRGRAMLRAALPEFAGGADAESDGSVER